MGGGVALRSRPGSYKGALNHTHRAAGGRSTFGEGMRRGVHRNRTIAIAVSVALVAVVFSGLGSLPQVRAQGVQDAASGTVDVTASNGFAFTPSAFDQVPTNATITVTFTDGSDLAHTFSIIGREGWVIPSTYTPTQIDDLAYGHSPTALYNANVTGSGDVVTGTFQSPGPGWYEFVCTEPGHFTSGMYGYIAFGISLPSNLTVSSGVPGPGAALFIIIGTIVAMVVVALVLGFVVGRRKGAMHEMPPERLGYPEPPVPGGPLPPASEENRHS